MGGEPCRSCGRRITPSHPRVRIMPVRFCHDTGVARVQDGNAVVDGVPMICQDFLARYSEFVDGAMEPTEAARWSDHLAECASCSRYDRVVRTGTDLVRGLPEIEPSYDFFPRLQHRIYNLDDDLRSQHRSSMSSAVVSLAVAGTLALLAWAPLLRFGVAPKVDQADPSSTTVAERELDEPGTTDAAVQLAAEADDARGEADATAPSPASGWGTAGLSATGRRVERGAVGGMRGPGLAPAAEGAWRIRSASSGLWPTGSRPASIGSGDGLDAWSRRAAAVLLSGFDDHDTGPILWHDPWPVPSLDDRVLDLRRSGPYPARTLVAPVHGAWPPVLRRPDRSSSHE